MSSRSGGVFGALGGATFASRVQGKFSIQLACEPEGSIACALAHVRGAFHQLWNLTDMSGMLGHQLLGERAHGRVAAMAVDDQHPAEPGPAHGGDDIAHNGEQRLDAQRNGARERRRNRARGRRA